MVSAPVNVFGQQEDDEPAALPSKSKLYPTILCNGKLTAIDFWLQRTRGEASKAPLWAALRKRYSGYRMCYSVSRMLCIDSRVRFLPRQAANLELLRDKTRCGMSDCKFYLKMEQQARRTQGTTTCRQRTTGWIICC